MITKINGVISWDREDFKEYHITGTDVHGRRFKIVLENWDHARHYNIFRGTFWGVKPDGKRMKLREV